MAEAARNSNTPDPVSSRPRGGLARAGESTDPVVQKLLAEREIHVSNGGFEDDPEIEARRKAAREAIKEIDDKLADLGYAAK